MLYYDADSIGGWSGCPVYTITLQKIDGEMSYVYTALAINNLEVRFDGVPEPNGFYNGGSLITKYQLQFFDIHSNPNIKY